MITFSGSGWTGGRGRKWITIKILKQVNVSLTTWLETYLNYRSPQAGGSQWCWKEAICSLIPLVCRRTSEGERARRYCKCKSSWDQRGLPRHQRWLDGEGLEPVWEEARQTNKRAFTSPFIQARGNYEHMKDIREPLTFVKVGPDSGKVCGGEPRV